MIIKGENGTATLDILAPENFIYILAIYGLRSLGYPVLVEGINTKGRFTDSEASIIQSQLDFIKLLSDQLDIEETDETIEKPHTKGQ